ncbi:hypothetical protein PIB30_037687 [Stylosanthes scabra]|uniref:Ubiquitin-like protease family profile domain-containing protein n=1 Tax=Stylosanthes scabra TaxID=79078 RepID=A0ABU6WER3_9FABA|nr:hypothetical protein [Stylosanthes scabra]
MGQDKGEESKLDSPPDPSIPSFSLNLDWSTPLGTEEQPPTTLEEEFPLTARTMQVIKGMDEHVSGDRPPVETPKPTQVIKDDLEERVTIWVTVVTLMCHVLNADEDERFEMLVYCVPPEILQRMFATHNHNWIDKKKRRSYEISSLMNHTEYLAYLDREKLNSHRFLFAPVLYSEHWWLSVLDKSKQEMFVLDSKNISSPSSERTDLNKFASNILNQLLKWAGAPSILKKGSLSLLPTYINIPQQPNDFDCAVFVMKWMEMIDPTILAGCCTYNIEQWTEPMLEEFRKKIVAKIILSKENSLRTEAIKEAHNMRLTRPGAALRSPYVQVTTPDLPTK